MLRVAYPEIPSYVVCGVLANPAHRVDPFNQQMLLVRCMEELERKAKGVKATATTAGPSTESSSQETLDHDVSPTVKPTENDLKLPKPAQEPLVVKCTSQSTSTMAQRVVDAMELSGATSRPSLDAASCATTTMSAPQLTTKDAKFDHLDETSCTTTIKSAPQPTTEDTDFDQTPYSEWFDADTTDTLPNVVYPAKWGNKTVFLTAAILLPRNCGRMSRKNISHGT